MYICIHMCIYKYIWIIYIYICIYIYIHFFLVVAMWPKADCHALRATALRTPYPGWQAASCSEQLEQLTASCSRSAVGRVFRVAPDKTLRALKSSCDLAKDCKY